MTPKQRPAPHLFQPGPADEADLNGRTVCQGCNLLGRPGDARHSLPPPVEDGRSRAAGERSEG